MYGLLDISASGMVASRVRLETASVNIANADSIEGPDGSYSPFQRRLAVIASGDPRSGSDMGVHVASIERDSEFSLRYLPDHKFADANGYVKFPNINRAIEMVNAIDAQRAYEANIVAAEATKSLASSALRLLA